MSFHVYGGPSYNQSNLKPFSWEDVKNNYHLEYNKGIPKVWIFKPFYFGLAKSSVKDE